MANRLVGKHVDNASYVEFSNVVFEPLKLNGSGTDSMSIDGSVTPQKFWYVAPPGFDLLVHRINFTMVDGTAMRADQFANIGGGLTNGLQIVQFDSSGNVIKEILEGQRIKTNGEFALFAGVDVANSAGTRGLFVRWTLSRATGGLPVRMPSGYGIGVIINDDLTSVDTFKASVQGIRVGNA